MTEMPARGGRACGFFPASESVDEVIERDGGIKGCILAFAVMKKSRHNGMIDGRWIASESVRVRRVDGRPVKERRQRRNGERSVASGLKMTNIAVEYGRSDVSRIGETFPSFGLFWR